MIQLLAHLRRVGMDAARGLALKPAAIQPISGHTGPWMIAAALVALGSILSVRHDAPELGWPIALTLGVAVLIVLAIWSRMDGESLQRSYVTAVIFAPACFIDGLSGQNAAGTGVMIVTSAWGLVAWIAYMTHRIRRET